MVVVVLGRGEVGRRREGGIYRRARGVGGWRWRGEAGGELRAARGRVA